MYLSWVEIQDMLSHRLKLEDYENLTPLLENIHALNNAYAYPKNSNHYDNIRTCLNDLSQSSLTKEQIKDKMQALVHCIDSINFYWLKPIMSQQLWFIKRMKALSYKIDERGQCYGISHMAIQAFFANDMHTFNQRLQKIYAMPIEDFENDFANLRKRRQALLDRGLNDEAEEINQTITDLYAFFDGIALTQMPMFFYDNINEPLSKKPDVSKTRPITIPVSLETKDPRNKNPNEPAIIATFPGIYNENDLQTHLDLLKKELGEHSFSLSLIAAVHAISIMYDAKNKHWILFDPNNLPGEEYTQTTHLTKAIFKDFSEHYPRSIEHLAIKTQITTTVAHQSHMKSKLNALQKTSTWSKIHDLSKSNRVDLMQWDLLIRDKNANAEDLLPYAIESGHHEFIKDFINTNGIARCKQSLEDAKVVKLAKILSNLPSEIQYQLLENLSIQKIRLIYPDFNDWKSFFYHLPASVRLQKFLDMSRTQQGQLLHVFPAFFLELFETLEGERLPVFIKLDPDVQKELADKYPDTVIRLLEKLSTNNKVKMISDNFAYYRKPTHLSLFAESEQISLFQNLAPGLQGHCLLMMSNIEQNKLIESLTTEQKAKILLAADNPAFKKTIQCWTVIFNSLPESELIRLFCVKYQTDYIIMRSIAKHPELQRLTLTCLQGENLFNQVSTNIHCFNQIPIEELRQILLSSRSLDSISDAALEIIKQDIAKASNLSELSMPAHVLNLHLTVSPTVSSTIQDLYRFASDTHLHQKIQNYTHYISSEDKLSILQSAANTLRQYVNSTINPDFTADAHQFIDALISESEELELDAALINLSNAAVILVDQVDTEKAISLFSPSIDTVNEKKLLEGFIQSAHHRKPDLVQKNLTDIQLSLKAGLKECKSNPENCPDDKQLAPK